MALVSIYDKHRNAIDDMLKVVKANQQELYEQKEKKHDEISMRAATIDAYSERKGTAFHSFWKLGKFCIIQSIRLLLTLDEEEVVDESKYLEASKLVKTYFETINALQRLSDENKIASRELREITQQYNYVTEQVEMFETIINSNDKNNQEDVEDRNVEGEDE